MSKDSSIKVFAENVGDTNPRPVNDIPVWIENVSAIGGGGGGDIPAEVSGKWEGASDCVQTNSASWNDTYSTVQSNSASWGQAPQIEFVSNSAAATGSNILYVVTGDAPTGGDTVTLANRIWKTANVSGEFGEEGDSVSAETQALGTQWFYTDRGARAVMSSVSADGWRVATSADYAALFTEYSTPADLEEAGFGCANISYYMYDDDPSGPLPEYDCQCFKTSTEDNYNWLYYAYINYSDSSCSIPDLGAISDWMSVRLCKDV